MRIGIFGSGAIGTGVILRHFNKMNGKVNEGLVLIARCNDRREELSGKTLEVRVVSADTEEVDRILLKMVISREDQAEMQTLFTQDRRLIICTAVKADNLPAVIQTISVAIKERIKLGITQPVWILPFENLPNNGKMVRVELKKYLDEESLQFVLTPSVMVDCMAFKSADGTVMREPFHEVVIENVDGLKEILKGDGMIFTENVVPYYNRKISLVSGIHTALGWLGLHYGFELVNVAAQDQVIRTQAAKLVRETSHALNLTTHFTSEELEKYGMKTIDRVANPKLPDKCQKFMRSLPGKLSVTERFAKPAIAYYGKTGDVPVQLCRILAIGLSLAQREEEDACFASLKALPEPLFAEVINQKRLLTLQLVV